MALEHVELNNFKIHRKTEFDFSDRLNFLVGGNGQGKTTVLEAIYFLCTTKGFRNSSDSECINFDGNNFEISGKFRDTISNDVRVYFAPGESRRTYFLDGKPVYRPSSIIGKFPVVLLTPEDHELTQGGPGGRRKFVDAILSQASEYYLGCLLDYGKVLKHRSSLLSQIKVHSRQEYLSQLEVWDEKLVKSGTVLINKRGEFIEEFAEYITTAYRRIFPDGEIPFIGYEPFPGAASSINESFFMEKLLQRRNEELRRESNLTGPHRDDFIFSVDNKNLKSFGSQGQHKTFQVALRFAQYYYLKNVTGKKPLFLLDDIYSELDKKRAFNISGYLNDIGQSFLTMTDFSNYEQVVNQSSDKVFYVKEGQAQREN